MNRMRSGFAAGCATRQRNRREQRDDGQQRSHRSDQKAAVPTRGIARTIRQSSTVVAALLNARHLDDLDRRHEILSRAAWFSRRRIDRASVWILRDHIHPGHDAAERREALAVGVLRFRRNRATADR